MKILNLFFLTFSVLNIHCADQKSSLEILANDLMAKQSHDERINRDAKFNKKQKEEREYNSMYEGSCPKYKLYKEQIQKWMKSSAPISFSLIEDFTNLLENSNYSCDNEAFNSLKKLIITFKADTNLSVEDKEQLIKLLEFILSYTNTDFWND